jgi:phenylalanyl-tRNA synthetase beta chain
MKIPIKWLRDYVDVTLSPDELARKLTMAGLEVGEIKDLGSGWKNIVVGEIIAISPHPNADRLRLATVGLGERETTVVCGAPNLTVGAKIAFAQVGATLKDGHTGASMELKPAKIRGVVSEGMVCSERELGISDSHEGILVLPFEAPIGTLLAEYLGGTVLDVEVTANRPDCLSVIGIAREVAALTDTVVHTPDFQDIETGKDINSEISIEIDEPSLCPRYCASLLTGIKIGSSPQWMQQRLTDCGMRPINNIVDITNYVMLEYGQPLHAFDYGKVRGKKIIVRRAKNGEILTTLDGIERTLKNDLLVIADSERAVAVAGVMGGASTEVKADTQVILLESANFNQAVVHKGSTELKLVSEASLRFEKGLSRELPLLALRRATQLITELAGAKAAKGTIDVYPGKCKAEPLIVSAAEVNRLLGMAITDNVMVKALTGLGFICQPVKTTGKFNVTVPWWRTDVTCTADLIEEVARIIGYDAIPTTMLRSSLTVSEPLPMLLLRQKVRDILVGCGCQEIINYSLTNMDMLSKLNEESIVGVEPVKLANPMNREQEYLRTSLRAGVISTLARNQRSQFKNNRIFEIGKVFIPDDNKLPVEKEMLCVLLWGLKSDVSWKGKAQPVDFFDAKGIVELLLSRLGISSIFLPVDRQGFCTGKAASIVVDNEVIGMLGELHSKVAAAFDLDSNAMLIELDLDRLSAFSSKSYKYQPLSRFPGVIRDIALVLDERVTFQQISDTIRSFPLVRQISLFDVYHGEQVAKGKKSLAFRVIYQSDAHTLADKEVDHVQGQILDKLSVEFGATLRA